ncbi:MAG TPA: PDZ domain-containing protein [Actinomycetes bacterium]|nr:PDZ domain-containing protein [Actinomycetes bacterium]
MTRRNRTFALVFGGVLLVALVVIAYLLPVPYVRLRPGPVFNALGDVNGKPVITVEGAQTYDTTGSLDVTTVYEDGGPGIPLTLLQAFRGWLDPTMTVVPRELVYSPDLYKTDTGATQVKQQGVAQMRESEQTSVVAALRYVGKPVHTVVVVGSTMPGAPADNVLQPGDRIISVSGHPVSTPDQVRAQVSKVDPGDEVTLVIERDSKRQDVRLSTIASTDKTKHALIGITPTVSFVSPVDVHITLADVGGPSAGLMFSLSIVDKLTPGPLAADRNIAGTGVMGPAGHVGPIGGIVQKMAGARADGASVFLAPASNCNEVVGHIPDGLRVVRVSTLTQAVHAVEQLGQPNAQLAGCS